MFCTFHFQKYIYIIHFAQKNNIPSIALSLDAEKAFDWLEWPYRFRALKKLGFDDHFINLIKSLYRSPKASVSVNGIISDHFPIFRDNRQGCPLSPALFALAMEPLADAVRMDSNILYSMWFSNRTSVPTMLFFS